MGILPKDRGDNLRCRGTNNQMKTVKEAFASLRSAKTLPSKAVAAFTLIEILIVVAIIGIILGIAVPALSTAREDALTTKERALEAQVATAKSRYYLANPGVSETNAPAFADIAPYLMVNGVANPAEAAFLGSFASVTIGDGATDPDVTR
jgi:prepilin-type N-terminal cleavage/methylation domain-containing protein